MSLRAQPKRRRWIGTAIAVLMLAVGARGSTPAQAAGDRREAGPQSHAPRGEYKAHRLQDRVKLLSKALALDVRQQAELRKILQSQREEVKKVWSDSSVAAAHRIQATQAIGERTTDKIRAILNDEQKKRFNPPRQAHEPAGPAPSVEDWMNKGTKK